MVQGKHESTEYPLLFEKTKTHVYVRSNIVEEVREGVTFYVYDEIAYPIEEWEREKTRADVDYIAFMTGVELDV